MLANWAALRSGAQLWAHREVAAEAGEEPGGLHADRRSLAHDTALLFPHPGGQGSRLEPTGRGGQRRQEGRGLVTGDRPSVNTTPSPPPTNTAHLAGSAYPHM